MTKEGKKEEKKGKQVRPEEDTISVIVRMPAEPSAEEAKAEAEKLMSVLMDDKVTPEKAAELFVQAEIPDSVDSVFQGVMVAGVLAQVVGEDDKLVNELAKIQEEFKIPEARLMVLFPIFDNAVTEVMLATTFALHPEAIVEFLKLTKSLLAIGSKPTSDQLKAFCEKYLKPKKSDQPVADQPK